MIERILLIGGSGQLGTALQEAIKDIPLWAPTHAELPFEDPTAIDSALRTFQPTLFVNCSAFHHVDTCEREPERAFAMNALAVDRAAQLCSALGIAFATVSTDYVFGGTAVEPYCEMDAVAPQTAYGASKAAGEFLVRRHGGRHYIIRTSGVFGNIGTSSKGYTLIDKVLAQAEQGQPTSMVADMVFSPSYAPHLARAIIDIFSAQAYGTHHVTNTGACSWYTFVQYAFTNAGLNEATLEPVSYASLENTTRRPMYSPLQNTTFKKLGIAQLPSWESALDQYLMIRSNKGKKLSL